MPGNKNPHYPLLFVNLAEGQKLVWERLDDTFVDGEVKGFTNEGKVQVEWADFDGMVYEYTPEHWEVISQGMEPVCTGTAPT